MKQLSRKFLRYFSSYQKKKNTGKIPIFGFDNLSYKRHILRCCVYLDLSLKQSIAYQRVASTSGTDRKY